VEIFRFQGNPQYTGRLSVGILIFHKGEKTE